MVCSYTREQRLSVVQASICLHCSCGVNRFCLPLPSLSGMGSFTGDNQNHISNFSAKRVWKYGFQPVCTLQYGERGLTWWSERCVSVVDNEQDKYFTDIQGTFMWEVGNVYFPGWMRDVGRALHYYIILFNYLPQFHVNSLPLKREMKIEHLEHLEHLGHFISILEGGR